MKQSSYRDRDYAFGQAMLTLRSTIGLTQAGLADFLGVSRRAVGDWEAGGSYPKVNHLKKFIVLAVELKAFPVGREEEAIRTLWQTAHQKVLLDEAWLAALLVPKSVKVDDDPPPVATHQVDNRQQPGKARKVVSNLPFQPTPFIGRAAELAEIARILRDPACHLITLLGPGGVGKTRLALEVAARQADTFTDGVAFIALASVDMASQIISAIGDALNLSFSGQSDPTTHLLTYLRRRHMLLVLDNFEHLLAGADLVYDILAYAPHITILVTSRTRLNLQAEWLFDVEGLAYPSEASHNSLVQESSAALSEYSAVQLFIQRVSQVQPKLFLRESTLPTIVSICQHVAGMPLAIELAAASVRILPITEIERQIRSNLDMFATTDRDVPIRHRSMRAAFEHSWDLLSEPERALLRRLAVFRGGWTADAAEVVTGATLSALGVLVDKSLVRQNSAETGKVPNGIVLEARFALLEPIREYALEKLAAHGEADALRHTHARYYLGLAEVAAVEWDSQTADVGIEQIDREHDNISAALQWAHDQGDRALGLQLVGALGKFWRRRGYISQGRAWLEAMLALDDDTDDTSILALRLRATNAAAWLASYQHDFAYAEQLFEQSMALRRALGEIESETHILDNAARQARAMGQYQRATALAEDALARHRAQGNRGSLSTGGLGRSLYEVGLIQREQGNFARATVMFEECIALHTTLADREGISIGLLGLGDVARDQGDIVQIRKYTEESLATLRKLGVQWAIGFALNNLAVAAYLEDDLPVAFDLISESVSMFRAQHADASLAEVLVTMGYILQARKDVEAAHEALAEALRLALAVGPHLLVAAALEGLAGVMSQSAQVVTVVQLLGVASALRAYMGTPLRPADQPSVEHILATARMTLGDNAFAVLWSEAEKMPLEQMLTAVPGTVSSDEHLSQASALSISELVEEAVIVPAKVGQRVDWGDALAVPTFYGREWELRLLREWVVEEHCRVVSVVGLGGIGKSALAVRLMRQVAGHFDVVIWRSLRDIPTCNVLLDDLLQIFAPQILGDTTLTLEKRQGVVLEHMRSTRILLVLDNLESVLDEGENAGRMLPDYEGFNRFLRLSAQTEHQSCVLLTSREKPRDLVTLEGRQAPVRALRLGRLDANACGQLLAEKDVAGTAPERARLIEAYAGNPLALKIVAQTIVDLFDGEIGTLLEQGEIIFGGVRDLLDEQFNRLSDLEQCVLLWLTIFREPSTLDELLAVLGIPISRASLLEAVEALRSRSLIERGQKQASFTLQSVVLEYATARLIAEAINEVREGRLNRLIAHGLELAHGREYVRQTQERLILAPILTGLHRENTRQITIEAQLRALLHPLSRQTYNAQGYGPANLIALLRLERGDLRGLNLSRLALRSVYLQGIEMQDAVLSQALIQDSIFSETFDAMIAVAISSDGEYWAASSRRGEVRVWASGGLILHRAWHAHTDMIWTIGFSPDGLTLATGSWDGTLKLWDVASGALLWSGNHTSHINGVVFAPDGRMIASSGNDATIRLWDSRTGKELQTLPHPDLVIPLAWSPEGHLIASGDVEGQIRLWQVNAKEPSACILTLTGHNSYVDGLAFSPDGSILASGSWDGTVKLWDVVDGQLRETLTGHKDRVSRVGWTPDGRTLVSSSRDQTIFLWDVEKGIYRAALQGHHAGVCGLAFTPDSRSLFSGSEDGSLRVWDIASGHCIRVIHGYAASLYDVDWSPDGTHVVSCGSDGLVTIYDVDGRTSPRVLRGHTGIVFAVRWSSDVRWLASSEWDNSIRVWDSTSGDCLQVLRHPDDAANFFYGLAWSPDAHHLASGTYRHGVQVFEMATNRRHWVASQFPTWIRAVAWNPEGTLLAGGGDDGIIYVWDAQGTLLYHLEGHHCAIASLVWSQDGSRLASGGSDSESGELFVWDARREKRLHSVTANPGIVQTIAWGGSEELLVSGGGDGILRWWDILSGLCMQVREAHQGTIHALRQSPDGTKLMSCGDDGAVILWDSHSGEYLQTLRRDRPYERLNITGIRGLTEAQMATLRALGAIENSSK